MSWRKRNVLIGIVEQQLKIIDKYTRICNFLEVEITSILFYLLTFFFCNIPYKDLKSAIFYDFLRYN